MEQESTTAGGRTDHYEVAECGRHAGKWQGRWGSAAGPSSQRGDFEPMCGGMKRKKAARLKQLKDQS